MVIYLALNLKQLEYVIVLLREIGVNTEIISDVYRSLTEKSFCRSMVSMTVTRKCRSLTRYSSCSMAMSSEVRGLVGDDGRCRLRIGCSDTPGNRI